MRLKARSIDPTAALLITGWFLVGCSSSSGGSQGLLPDGAVAPSDDAATGPSGSIACVSDKQCTASGQLCDTKRAVCVDCLDDSGCSATQICEQGACVVVEKCENSLDCSAGKVCDRTQSRCVECVANGDCTVDQVCAANACRPKCSSDKDCRAAGLLCDTSVGHCSECAMGDCLGGGLVDGGAEAQITPPTRDSAVDAAPNDGLAGYWKLDEGVGSLTADSSGSGHSGTFQGLANWTTGKYGSAVSLNGTSAFVEIPGPVIDTSKPFTAAAFVRLATLTGAYKTIVSIDGTSGSGFYLQQRMDTGTFAIVMSLADSPTVAVFAGAPTSPAAGVWYHVAGVYDGAALTVYVNGVQQGSVAHSGAWSASGNTYLGRGKYNGLPTDYLPGLIDEVRLYRRALSAQEIAQLANP